MADPSLKIGIVGREPDVGQLSARLASLPGIVVVGWAGEDSPLTTFADDADPDALIILNPHPDHYRPAMEALQAGCHAYLDRPFGVGVQEAVDIAGLSKAHDRKAAVGGHLRMTPSFIAARERVRSGEIGAIRMVTVLGRPGDVAALVDALLWTTGRLPQEVAAIGDEAGVMVVSARLTDDILVSLCVPGDPAGFFEVDYHGEFGRLRVTATDLHEGRGDVGFRAVDLPSPGLDLVESFIQAITSGIEPSCPAGEAIDAARFLEAISRSIATGQVVHLA